jgi:hypothetical protein
MLAGGIGVKRGRLFVCAALVANAEWMTSLFIENDFFER